jgi:UDP-N-acetylglucosamine--N-acetylmuramyl-(pentapeptide) pyrophosphoryl-undecaprenol N-acetylglucosamine transferase
MLKTIFITSGGTGGHIIPARCLAELLSSKNYRVIFFGDYKVKNYQKKQDQFLTKVINSSQLKKSPIDLFKAILQIFFGIVQSIFYLIKFRPFYIFGFGGYASFPMLIASTIFKKRIILHEQNSHLGKVNRIFSKFAYKIATSFPNTSGINNLDLHKVILTGNPVRQEIIKLNQLEYQIPKKIEKIHSDNNTKINYNLILASEFFDTVTYEEKINILVIGGSGGAKIFSDVLPKTFANLPLSIKEKLVITQQCRKDLVDSTIESYKKLDLNVEVKAFFENIPEILKDVHLVIARSGSSSIAEFCVAKKPMILIPFELSADHHQQKNAEFINQNNAGIIIKESDFNIDNTTKILLEILSSKNQLELMSKNAEKLAMVNATYNLSKIIDN